MADQQTNISDHREVTIPKIGYKNLAILEKNNQENASIDLANSEMERRRDQRRNEQVESIAHKT